MRKVQVYITEEQYRLLRQRAGNRGSIAGVVRDLIDSSLAPTDPTSDPLYRHLTATKGGSGRGYSAEKAKRDLYRKPR